MFADACLEVDILKNREARLVAVYETSMVIINYYIYWLSYSCALVVA